MHELLSRNLFFIKEHVGMFKAANEYDIFDPESQQEIMRCREPKLGMLTKMLRFTDFKRNTPFDVHVVDTNAQPVVRISRGVSLLLSKVSVFDEYGHRVGGFQQKLFSIGGRFDVLDANGQVVCELKGKTLGWDFKFLVNGREIAAVTKKWAGLGRELFTTADNYILQIDESVEADDPLRLLILGSIMCIDMVLKE